MLSVIVSFFFCKHKTSYEMRISDWSSDVLFRPIARQEALEHERDQIGHGFAHPVDSLISVGIVVEHLFEVGKHADRQLDRRSVWQFGKLEFSHVSGSTVARTLTPDRKSVV